MNEAYSYLRTALQRCITPKETEFKLLDYTFKLKRYYNNLNFSDSDCNQYIIECKIFNNINAEIYSFRMNESDCARLIENVSVFLYEFDYTGSSMYIGLCTDNNHLGYYPTIYLYKSCRCGDEEDYEQFGAWFYNKDSDEVRYIDFTLLNDRGKAGQDVIFKIPIGATELEEFIYELCFVSDAEVVLPSDYDISYY